MEGVFAAMPWLVAGVALLISLYAVRRDIQWKRAEKLETTAEIVGVSESTDSDDHTTYAARYRFRAIDGRTIETIEQHHRRVSPIVGERVRLYYDRERPERIFHDARGMGLGAYAFLAVFNALMIGFAWLFTRLAGG